MTEQELKVLNACAQHFGVTGDEILTGSRSPKATDARHCFWIILRQGGMSSQKIGRLSEHDHTTVIHACRGESLARLFDNFKPIRELMGESAANGS